MRTAGARVVVPPDARGLPVRRGIAGRSQLYRPGLQRRWLAATPGPTAGHPSIPEEQRDAVICPTLTEPAEQHGGCGADVPARPIGHEHAVDRNLLRYWAARRRSPGLPIVAGLTPDLARRASTSRRSLAHHPRRLTSPAIAWLRRSRASTAASRVPARRWISREATGDVAMALRRAARLMPQSAFLTDIAKSRR